MDGLSTKPLEKAIDILLDLTIRHALYIINCEKNESELNQLVDDLGREKETVGHQVREALDNVKGTNENAVGWSEKAETMIEEVQKFQNDTAAHINTTTGCEGVLPFLWHRHQRGRKAKKMAADVEALLSRIPSGGVSFEQNPTYIEATFYNTDYAELDSRRDTMLKIMQKLEDPSVRMIGVHGPGGMGKTTLVKQIAKEAREKKLFTVVVKADVTNNPNPQKIQDEIAYVLGLRFEGEGETGRADRLRRRLKQEKENTLLILDDLWDRLDLDRLGIPFHDDDDGDDDDDDDDNHAAAAADFNLSQMKDNGEQKGKMKDNDKPRIHFKSRVKKVKSHGEYKGCKILLTSRDIKVLTEKMNAEEKSIFAVEALPEEDALKLFKKVADVSGEISKSQEEIVKKYCAGSPMAIVTVGKGLRNKRESIWDEELEKLKRQSLMRVQKSMEFSVKMSYDHLESDELKSIFLLCARMGHQPLIMDLVKNCFGLGILDGVDTLKEAREEIYASIQKLKDSNLLLSSDSSCHFNMHDTVRDAALSIARKEHNVFTLRNGRLNDWPDKDQLERCTVISIHNSVILDKLPHALNCPQLKVLHIDSNDPSMIIPNRFFEKMEKLRVLILTGFHLEDLPSSIENLLNLRMMCLEQCNLSGNLSIIGKLEKLRILSLFGSQIENLPTEVGCLSYLQLLDISDCSIVKVISPTFILSLTSLEELYIKKSLITKKVEGGIDESLRKFLEALCHLHKLNIIDLSIPNAAVLPMNLFFDKLNDYKIMIGDFQMHSVGEFKMPSKYEALRSLALELRDDIGIHSQKGIKKLFKRVENLLLGKLKDVQNAFYELNLDGFPDLKHLSIINNQSIEYIISSMEFSHAQDAFPKLDFLCLDKMSHLKMICCSEVTGTSFNNLKTIKVKMCFQLKNLFSFYMVEFLKSLEAIDVSECDSLEDIVAKEGQASNEKVKFHKLRSLTLRWLPSLSSFYANQKPSLPQRIEGQATNNDEITNVNDEHIVMTSLSLFSEMVEIPNLESLKLSSIDVKKIWPNHPSTFCFGNLIKLTVKDCRNLSYLCSLSVAGGMKKLKGLFISGCPKMVKIFNIEGNASQDYSKVDIFPKMEEIQLTDMNMLKEIWQEVDVGEKSFSSLVSLHIERCNQLKKIFPSHMVGRFESLESVKVVDCESVEVVFELPISQPQTAHQRKKKKVPPQKDASGIDTKLRFIHLLSLWNMKHVWDKDPRGILNFKSLQSIIIYRNAGLRNVLPASVAKNLEKLEEFSVSYCYVMEEIVAKEIGLQTINEPLVFPEVTSMEFAELPLKHFYKGRHPIECPNLKRLAVKKCDKLKIFTTKTKSGPGKPLFLAEKVLSQLEYLEIDKKQAKRLQSDFGKYMMHNLKELCLNNLESIDLLYWFLHRIPNLEILNLSTPRKYIKKLVPDGIPEEKLGTVVQLKELTLIWSDITDIGFQRGPILQRVERLVLMGCWELINFVDSSVSLSHLTYLEVNRCKKLKNIMASSTAKSLVQLTTLRVIHCEGMTEIISNEGKEGEEEKVVFSKLITLELVELEKLELFYSYQNCKIEFPALEKLIVRDCPRMETFTKSHLIAPKLQNILAIEGEEEGRWFWQGDLNSTIQKGFTDEVYFEFMEYLDLSEYPQLIKQAWLGNDFVQENKFRNLKSLKVQYCNHLVHVIPSHLLNSFKNLEELEVKDCSEVQVILNNTNDDTLRVRKALSIFRLKKLILSDLPKLEHVWNKDPIGILGFQVPPYMKVKRCDSLKCLFPAWAAKDHARLEYLSVEMCNNMVEIFAKDENEVEDTEGATQQFVFHCLTSLTLGDLPGLKYFQAGLRKLEFPVLQWLSVDCPGTLVLECQEAHLEDQALHLIEKVTKIPSFQELELQIGNGNRITWYPKSQKLVLINNLQVPYGILQMIPKIEDLELSGGSIKEMFTTEKPNACYTELLLHLKRLEIRSPRGDLKSIGLEHSWLHPVLENLHILEVSSADGINLVPCTVSFSNLTDLVVSNCNEMLSLLENKVLKSGF
ncbi:hypothetical protein RIF29_16217 [Crotalaria pallida]|uniref:AAA+ ATPase domain-containing protein n=1 Tax=Crotalaria pallida TaxID=3830 RepID=A0AAN9IFC9_CROPI